MKRPTITALAILIGSQSACVMAPTYRYSPEPQDDRLRVRVTTFVNHEPMGQEGESLAFTRSEEGRLLWADADTIRIYATRLHRRIAIPSWSIAKLEVYRDQKGSAKAAAKGGVTGAAVGALAGGMLGFATEAALGGMWNGRRDYSRAVGEGAATGAFAGGVMGVALGAVAGEEVWEAISLRELREELCMCRIDEAVVTQ